MTPDQLEEVLKRAMSQVLDSRDRIDHGTHKQDHDWIECKRARERVWNERFELAQKSAVGFITLGVLGLVVKFFAFIGGLVIAYFTIRNGEPPTGGP